ncbi:response regulator [Paenibacillus mendelii]|uniref:Response regulator n=1 Tax=Paenibacillus mendelii TaxID=206163 RepID=A0ABV6J9E8_9BACL|nr:response regulator [Paenibacillus mendelii]MCQ6559862.1 response regulator [Paenibacillus mendelii]
MYRMLIVDDEPAIVDGLMQFFQDMEDLELDLCKAYSASEALDIVKKTKVDLIISDIRMPGRSGLQLIDDVLFYWPACRIILLTGYSDFEYAHKAIQKNVDSYILKTEGLEIIHEAVQTALTKIDDEYRAKTVLELAELKLAASESLLKKEYLEALLIGEEVDETWGRHGIESLSLQINSPEPLILIAARVDRLEEKVPNRIKSEVQWFIRNLLADRLPKQLRAEAIHLDRAESVWFLQPAQDADRFVEQGGSIDWRGIIDYTKGLLEPVQSSCREEFGVSVSFIVSRGPLQWEEISGEFERIKDVFKQYAVTGQPMAIVDLGTADDGAKREARELSGTSMTVMNNKLIALEKRLDAGDVSGAALLTSELVQQIKLDIACSYTIGMENYYRLILAFLSYMNGIQHSNSLEPELRMPSIPFLEAPTEWESVEERMLRLSESICRIKQEQLAKSENLIVERIHRFINDNLGGDLSLARIAEVVYFNPSYLSRFYKQLTGRNLSEYINETKSETAVRLLSQTQMKVSEIALKLGFESPSYFTSFFRKMIGTTPQDYRETACLK